MSHGPVENTRRRLLRYGTVVAIVIVVGGLFAVRELGGEDTIEGTGDGDQRLEVGVEAPDFQVETLDGTFRLSEARGEIVVVNFWATWCLPCLHEMPEFQELHETRGERDGIRLVAVNFTTADSRDAVDQYVEDLGLTFTVGLDPSGAISERYGVRSLPATFFIDRDGILRDRTYGPVVGERLEESLAAAGG